MARQIDLGALEQRARAALGRLSWWDPRLPRDRQRPQVYQTLLRGAVIDMGDLADDPAYLHARSAVDAWAAAEGLRERATQVLNDPDVRAFANHNGHDLQWYAENPDRALRVLAEARQSLPHLFKDGMPLHQAMALAGEAIEFHQDNAGAADLPQAQEQDPLPPYRGSAVSEYQELIGKPRLSQAERDRLVEIASGYGQEVRATPAPAGEKAPASYPAASGGAHGAPRYDELIAKENLTEAEHQELQQISADHVEE